jgi:hypothetical protein
LNYIHPFPDGNGRVSRLMSHAMALTAGIGGQGLWSVSRGLARGLAFLCAGHRFPFYAAIEHGFDNAFGNKAFTNLELTAGMKPRAEDPVAQGDRSIAFSPQVLCPCAEI